MKKKMCVIDGKRYIAPGTFADACGWSSQKVTAACKDGRVVGAYQDLSNNWLIPIDAPMPLDKEKIRELMVACVCLKNRPDLPLDYNNHERIVAVYMYLMNTGYIEPFDERSDRIPYEVVLTEKGMKVATEGKSVTLNWLQIGSSVIQVAASIITIVQAFR